METCDRCHLPCETAPPDDRRRPGAQDFEVKVVVPGARLCRLCLAEVLARAAADLSHPRYAAGAH